MSAAYFGALVNSFTPLLAEGNGVWTKGEDSLWLGMSRFGHMVCVDSMFRGELVVHHSRPPISNDSVSNLTRSGKGFSNDWRKTTHQLEKLYDPTYGRPAFSIRLSMDSRG